MNYYSLWFLRKNTKSLKKRIEFFMYTTISLYYLKFKIILLIKILTFNNLYLLFLFSFRKQNNE